MAGGDIEELLEEVLGLGEAEIERFLYKIEVRRAAGRFLRERAALPAPEACPRCGSTSIARRGHDGRGRQRWQCAGCGRSFTADTFGVVSRSHLPAATWAAFCAMFCARETLRACAAALGVSLKTAHYMRVRVCSMLGVEVPRPAAAGGDVVQGDEAFLPESFSGNHSRGRSFSPWRPPRRRGGGRRERECLLTLAVPRVGADVSVVATATRPAAALEQLRAVCPRAGTRLALEMGSSIAWAAGALGIPVERSYSDERRLNAVNSAHSALKHFVARFRGISSRHMQRYMDWFRWHSLFRGPGAALERALALMRLLAVGRAGVTRSGLFGSPYPVDARMHEIRARATKKG